MCKDVIRARIERRLHYCLRQVSNHVNDTLQVIVMIGLIGSRSEYIYCRIDTFGVFFRTYIPYQKYSSSEFPHRSRLFKKRMAA